MTVLARGRHRRRRFHRPAPAARPDDGGLVLAEAAGSCMTIGELRAFLVRAEAAAAVAGADPGSLRWRVAVRHSGFARAIWVKLP